MLAAYLRFRRAGASDLEKPVCPYHNATRFPECARGLLLRSIVWQGRRNGNALKTERHWIILFRWNIWCGVKRVLMHFVCSYYLPSGSSSLVVLVGHRSVLFLSRKVFKDLFTFRTKYYLTNPSFFSYAITSLFFKKRKDSLMVHRVRWKWCPKVLKILDAYGPRMIGTPWYWGKTAQIPVGVDHLFCLKFGGSWDTLSDVGYTLWGMLSGITATSQCGLWSIITTYGSKIIKMTSRGPYDSRNIGVNCFCCRFDYLQPLLTKTYQNAQANYQNTKRSFQSFKGKFKGGRGRHDLEGLYERDFDEELVERDLPQDVLEFVERDSDETFWKASSMRNCWSVR